LLKAIEGDKKRSGNSLHLIYPTAIGAVTDRTVEYNELAEAL
jgi:3-dehydroquinate synthetase